MNMEKYNLQDDHLKSMLEGVLFIPDEKQKELFINNAGKLRSKKQKRRYLWILSSIVALVITTTVLSLALSTSKNEVLANLENQPLQNVPSTIINESNNDISSDHHVITPSVTNPQTISQNEQNTKTSTATKKITERNFDSKISFPSNIFTFSTESIPNSEPLEPIHLTTTENIPVYKNEIEEKFITNEPIIENKFNEIKDTLIHPIVENQNKEINKNHIDKKSGYAQIVDDLKIYVSIFYRPEIIYNIIDNDKFIHNAGLEFTFHPFNPRYVVRTGFGVSLSQGFYEYQIDYNKYLGSYDKLDSVSFSLGSNGFNLIPQYYFSNQDVYNEELNSYFTKVYRKFIYLQIPLELGYDFYKKEKFTMGFRTGPTLSLLMNQPTSQLIIDESKDKIIQINQITPERIAANWQYMIGFNFTTIKNRFIFEIEPRVAYYFNSVYEKGDQTQSPYSVNIRFAIGIK